MSLAFKKKRDNTYELYDVQNSKNNVFEKLKYFTLDQYLDFDMFYHKILNETKINNTYKTKIMSSGTHGIAISYKQYVIKIIKIYNHITNREKYDHIINELIIFYDIFFSGTAIPYSINQIKGYVTGNKKFNNDKLKIILSDRGYNSDIVTNNTNGGIYGIIPKEFDITRHSLKMDQNFYYFMEKGDFDLQTFNISKMTPENILKFINNYIKDMAVALDFIHNKNYLHCDIKTENIVRIYKSDGNTMRHIYQLIDLGGMKKIDKYISLQGKIIMTPDMFYGTKYYYTRILTKEYDWYCTMLSLLEIIDFFDCKRTEVYNQIYEKNNYLSLYYYKKKIFRGIESLDLRSHITDLVNPCHDDMIVVNKISEILDMMFTEEDDIKKLVHTKTINLTSIQDLIDKMVLHSTIKITKLKIIIDTLDYIK